MSYASVSKSILERRYGNILFLLVSSSCQVKKGLEKLYRKVEKDLCEEEGMLQVVWGNIQNAFMRQCQHFKGLIDLCYPDSNMTFEFSLVDIEEFFSTAQHSH